MGRGGEFSVGANFRQGILFIRFWGSSFWGQGGWFFRIPSFSSVFYPTLLGGVFAYLTRD